MQIPILIEAIGDNFRARAGEPFGLCAEGQSEKEATERLADLLRKKLHEGARLSVLEIGNGPTNRLQLDPLPEDDWFFQTMREAISESRQKEDEAEQ